MDLKANKEINLLFPPHWINRKIKANYWLDQQAPAWVGAEIQVWSHPPRPGARWHKKMLQVECLVWKGSFYSISKRIKACLQGVISLEKSHLDGKLFLREARLLIKQCQSPWIHLKYTQILPSLQHGCCTKGFNLPLLDSALDCPAEPPRDLWVCSFCSFPHS